MMNTTRPDLRGASALAIVCLCGAPSLAQQTCSSDQVALQPTNWTETLTFERFDPDLGILTSIDFTLSGNAEGSAQVENLDATPTTVTTQFQATLRLDRPDTTTLVAATPGVTFNDDLDMFDGIIDFMGPSGVTHAGIVATGMDSATSTSMADFALFTGPAGNPGTIDLDAFALGTSTASGPGNVIAQFMTSAAATVEICYTYAPDCNGNGVPDDQDINSGTSNDFTPDGIPDECQPATTSFCEGDGSANGGIDCPCGNNGAPGEGCANGTGSGLILTASGVPSVSNDTLSLTVNGLPAANPGAWFFSTMPAGGGDGVPFANGLLCLDTPMFVVKQTGGGSLPLPTSPPLSTLLMIQAGTTNYFQYWYRDRNGPCPGAISANTTNGIRVTWGL